MPHWLVFFETLGESFTVYDKPYAILAGRSEAVGFFLSPLTPGRVEPGLHLLALVLLTAVATAPRRLWQSPICAAAAVASAGLIAVAFGAVPASVLVRVPLVGNIGHINDAFVTAALPLLLIVCACGARVLLTATGPRVVLVTCLVGILLFSLLFVVQELASDGSFEPLALILVTAPLVSRFPRACSDSQPWAPRSCLALQRFSRGSSCCCRAGSTWTPEFRWSIDFCCSRDCGRWSTRTLQRSMLSITRHESPRERSVWIGPLFSGSQALYELEGIGGADPLELPAYRELIDASQMWRDWGWFTMVRQADVPRSVAVARYVECGFRVVASR